jgi:PKD repeat protein
MRVAEDFLPFDVDVTTEEPSPDRITRTNLGDEYFGVPILITPTVDWFGSAGGVAYVGIFNYTSNYYKPAFVFSSMLANAEKYIAEAISHEAGHNLSLYHDGDVSTAYYYGHGDGQIGWAPIMGVGYYKNLVQWSKGEYPNANNLEDDLSKIQLEGEFGYREDDHGNSISSATWISSQADGTLSAKGIIEQNTDIDVFGFATELGQVLINITPALKGPNLDILTELYDENGFFVLSDNPSLELASGIDTTLNQGIYYLVIKGTENINASDYGSMGSYSISATLPVSGSNSPPEAVASSNPTSGMAPLTVSFSGSGSSDSDGDIVSYSWDFKDNNAYGSGANTDYTYTTEGTYNVELTVIDDKGATDLSIVTVEVTQAPVDPPIAAFSVDPASGGAAPLTVQFTDGSGGVITNWNWKIERYHEKRNRWINVTDLTEQDPSVVLEKASSYRTTLTVTGPGGFDIEVGNEITVTGSTKGGGNNGGGNNGGGGRGKNN